MARDLRGASLHPTRANVGAIPPVAAECGDPCLPPGPNRSQYFR